MTTKQIEALTKAKRKSNTPEGLEVFRAMLLTYSDDLIKAAEDMDELLVYSAIGRTAEKYSMRPVRLMRLLAAFAIQRIKEGHIEIVGLKDHLEREEDPQEEKKEEFDSDSVVEGSAYIGSLVKKHFENEMAGWKTKSAPRWLTLKGASVYSGLSSAGIGRLASLGKIRSSLVSISGTKRGRRLVDRLSLDEFIESFWDKDEFFTWQGYPA